MKKIYILHGWAYSVERWKSLIQELDRNDIKVEMLKIPGLTVPLDRVWDIDDYVSWLNNILRKESGQVVLLGHSNGGLISLAYALKYPQKIEKLFLIDNTGIYHNELGIRIKRWIFASAARAGKRLTKSEVMKKLLYKAARAHDYENADPIVKKTMINLIHTDLKKRLIEIKIPTTIIWGKNDQVTPLSDGIYFSNFIQNSKLFVIKNARHSPQHTNHSEVAEIIINNI